MNLHKIIEKNIDSREHYKIYNIGNHLSFFTFFMLILVSADNFIQLFLGVWDYIPKNYALLSCPPLKIIFPIPKHQRQDI